jgi:hypothetical protein
VTFNAHISIIVLYHLHFSCILLPFSCVPLHVAVSGIVSLRRVLWCCVRGCSPLLGVDSCTFFFLGSQTGPCSDPNCCGLTSQQHASVLKKKRPSVCSRLLSFYLYFKPHTRCRVGRELVTGARGCIIHEQELLSLCCG